MLKHGAIMIPSGGRRLVVENLTTAVKSEGTAGMRTAETAAGAQRDMKSERLMLKHIKEPPPHTHTQEKIRHHHQRSSVAAAM